MAQRTCRSAHSPSSGLDHCVSNAAAEPVDVLKTFASAVVVIFVTVFLLGGVVVLVDPYVRPRTAVHSDMHRLVGAREMSKKGRGRLGEASHLQVTATPHSRRHEDTVTLEVQQERAVSAVRASREGWGPST